MLGHKLSLNKFLVNEILQSTFSDHSTFNSEISNVQISRKYTQIFENQQFIFK